MPFDVRVEQPADDIEVPAQRFLGSPTLRIDGEDVDPTASVRTDFGLKCRLYASREGLRGTVPDELVRAALARGHGGPTLVD